MDTPPTPSDVPTPASRGLDRLIEAGWDARRIAGSADDRAAAATVARLFGVLDAGLDAQVRAGRELRIESTMARVAAAATGSVDAIGVVGGHGNDPVLAARDAQDLDALIGAGWSGGATSNAARLVALLGASSAEHTGDRTRVIESTLALVEAETERERSRFRIRPSDDRVAMPRRLRMADLGALAAMFLIGVGILWPVVTGMRAEDQRMTGAANMQAAGIGFGQFASDNRDLMPYYSGRDANGVWWRVGDPPRSHSANLFTLVRAGYASVAELASPGNAAAPTREWDAEAKDWRAWEEVSYSYQLFGDEVPRLTTGRGEAKLVLTDRSPVIDQARRGQAIDPMRGSPNTRGWGQHLLFSDGRVMFSRSPVLPNGDNIWLPRQLDDRIARLQGTERPADATDAFVGP
jgi:hypothetical protein